MAFIALAYVGVLGCVLLGFCGGVHVLITAEAGEVEHAAAGLIGGFASFLWIVTLVMSALIKDRGHRLITLQRVMFWMAGAGVTFLVIPWDHDGAIDVLGDVAMFWMMGGAMGIFLEPARALTSNQTR